MSAQVYVHKIKVYLKRQFSLSEEQVDGMIPDFIATLSNHMDNLERELHKGDLVALGKSGHTMKGALVNLGLDDYAELASQIELGGKEGGGGVNFVSISEELRVVVDQMLLYEANE